MLKVSPNGSVLDRRGKLLLPDAVVEDGSFTDKQIEQLLASGSLVDTEAAPAPAKAVETLPAITEEGEPTTVEVPAVKTFGKWRLDPDGLRGKPLEELNVMIIERDGDVEPFEDAEEAIAFLSQDYEEPEA